MLMEREMTYTLCSHTHKQTMNTAYFSILHTGHYTSVVKSIPFEITIEKRKQSFAFEAFYRIFVGKNSGVYKKRELKDPPMLIFPIRESTVAHICRTCESETPFAYLEHRRKCIL